MSTATSLYGSTPLTLLGTEKVAGDRASDGVTGGMLTQDIANLYKGTKGTDLASAATVNLGAAAGNFVHITGTTTIAAFDSVAAGVYRIVSFDAALTLTHNGTSLILPRGANIVTAAGDCAGFVSEGSGNWRCAWYQRKNGQALSNAVTALTSNAGVLNIDCALGDYFTYTATENITSISFSNLPATGSGRTIMLEFTQHASSAKTVTWPSSFKWAGGSAGTVSSTTSAVDVLALTSFNQGSAWRATLAKAFA